MNKPTEVTIVDNDAAVTVKRDYWDVLPEICQRLSSGEVLEEMCTDGHLPCFQYFYEWLSRDPKAHEAYIRARRYQGNFYFDKIITLANNMTNQNCMRSDKQIGALKWITGKLNHVYADNPQTIVDQSQHVHVQQLQDDQSEKSNRLLLAAKKRALPGA